MREWTLWSPPAVTRHTSLAHCITPSPFACLVGSMANTACGRRSANCGVARGGALAGSRLKLEGALASYSACRPYAWSSERAAQHRVLTLLSLSLAPAHRPGGKNYRRQRRSPALPPNMLRYCLHSTRRTSSCRCRRCRDPAFWCSNGAGDVTVKLFQGSTAPLSSSIAVGQR
ncbi:hypothetical protein PSPO01_14274 [Paraphaeosphaeria sporulosa]